MEQLLKKHKRCDEFLINALNDPEIKSFLPDGVIVECLTCEAEAFFSTTTNSIGICANNILPFQSIFNHALKHEAVHAKDFKYFQSFSDPCLFRACTEIRANKFSGQCSSLIRDFMRVALPDFKACVYKLAKISHDSAPSCKSKPSVDLMWDFCFNSELDQDLSQAESKE